MKNLVILGAGTAGTMMASHLKKELNKLTCNNGFKDIACSHLILKTLTTNHRKGYLQTF